MEEGNTKNGLLFLVIIIAGIWIWSNYKKINDLEEKVNYLEDRTYDYSIALQEANNNIEEANSFIEDAQGYAWSSYDEMGEVLDNLMTVETISEP